MKKIIILICIVHQLFTPTRATASSTLPISQLIAISFLQARKREAKKTAFLFETKESKIFSWAKLHDIDMSISQEVSHDGKKTIIIKAIIYGAPEDFADIAILAHERDFLKHIIIHHYRTQLQKLQKDKKQSIEIVPLDDHSKVVGIPEKMVRVSRHPIFGETREPVNRLSMEVETYLSQDEFDALVKEYFDDKVEPKKSWWR